VKAITLHQPWASAIALGLKRFETRGFRCHYRGEIAIHAGKTIDEAAALRLMADVPIIDFPLGAVIALATLTEVYPTCGGLLVEDEEKRFGDWRAGRFAWQLDNVRELRQPYPARGYQWVWSVPGALSGAIRRRVY
jgi:hypothetical protein